MKYGYIERERRFLVKTLPSDLNLEQDYRRICDRYFPNTFLRLRKITTPDGQLIQQKFARKETAGDSNHHAYITNLYLTPHVIGIDVFEGHLSSAEVVCDCCDCVSSDCGGCFTLDTV